MPPSSPAFPPGPYRFVDHQYFIIRYRTDLEALPRVVPEPLEIIEPVVSYEFIRMPDLTGFGDYTESGQVIAVRYGDHVGGYTHRHRAERPIADSLPTITHASVRPVSRTGSAAHRRSDKPWPDPSAAGRTPSSKYDGSQR